MRFCHCTGYGIHVQVTCADGSSALSKDFRDREVCTEALQVMVASDAREHRQGKYAAVESKV